MTAPRVTREDRKRAALGYATLGHGHRVVPAIKRWVETGEADPHWIGLHLLMLATVVADAREAAIAAERAAIIAFLRVETDGAGDHPPIVLCLANEIERGEHAKEMR